MDVGKKICRSIETTSKFRTYPTARLIFFASLTFPADDAASDTAVSLVRGLGSFIKFRKRCVAERGLSYARGNTILNVVPFPNSLSTFIVPSSDPRVS